MSPAAGRDLRSYPFGTPNSKTWHSSQTNPSGAMKITTIGRGTIGGTLARLWSDAGHDVTQLGHDGGDATDADVVLLAVPNQAVPAALREVTGLAGKTVVDATNRLDGEDPPTGFASIAEYVKSVTGGTVAKAFNLNYGNTYPRAADMSTRPGNIWVGDDDARQVVEQLSSDVGMQAVKGGGLDRAAIQESFGYLMNAIIDDVGGTFFYRFATPDDF